MRYRFFDADARQLADVALYVARQAADAFAAERDTLALHVVAPSCFVGAPFDSAYACDRCNVADSYGCTASTFADASAAIAYAARCVASANDRTSMPTALASARLALRFVLGVDDDINDSLADEAPSAYALLGGAPIDYTRSAIRADRDLLA